MPRRGTFIVNIKRDVCIYICLYLGDLHSDRNDTTMARDDLNKEYMRAET